MSMLPEPAQQHGARLHEWLMNRARFPARVASITWSCAPARAAVSPQRKSGCRRSVSALRPLL